MKALAFTLTVVFLLLQHRLWLSDDGWQAVQGLRHELSAARGENARLEARNLRLLVELGYLAAPHGQGGTPARAQEPAAPARLAGSLRTSEPVR
jgi:hypothetical protein